MRKILLFCLLLGNLQAFSQICSVDTIPCNTSLQSIIGNDTTTNFKTNYPSPYGNWYTSARHQFLYTAAELHAAGMNTACKIDQVDFNISETYGITLYHNYTINMGCTSVSSLSTWIDSTCNVYTPKNYTISTGWNSHPLDFAYEWDGISNLVVDICFYEGPGIHYTYNSSSPYTTTSFPSCLYINSDSYNLCQSSDSLFSFVMNMRPNIRLHSCAITTSLQNLNPDDFKPSVFPNPSNGNFEILGPDQTYTIEIYDLKGEKVYYDAGIGTKSVLLNRKEKGIYFYKIYCADRQKIYTGKIILIN